MMVWIYIYKRGELRCEFPALGGPQCMVLRVVPITIVLGFISGCKGVTITYWVFHHNLLITKLHHIDYKIILMVYMVKKMGFMASWKSNYLNKWWGWSNDEPWCHTRCCESDAATVLVSSYPFHALLLSLLMHHISASVSPPRLMHYHIRKI